MLVLSAEETAALLPMDKAIELVESAMKTTSNGGAILPLRTAMDLGAPNKLGIMPGAIEGPDCFGVKLISLYPDNPLKGYSSHLGLMVLFEREHGTPTAIMSAGMLTAVRTAAASAVATRLLARENARILAIIGTGEQAEYHIQSILAVRDIREVRIIGRDPERTENFVAKLCRQHPDLPINIAETVKDGVRDADIICTVTSSKDTVLQGAWVKAGAHVNAVGASVPSVREIDEELVANASLYVDYRPSALAQAKDIIAAIECGRITQDHIIAEVGEVLSGNARGRIDDEEITLYRSLGIAAQDLICAHHVMTAAKIIGAGSDIAVT